MTLANPERWAHEARRIEIIANPGTRMRASQLAAAVASWPAPRDDVRLRFTDGPGDARRLAERVCDDADVVVAAGGDGTAGEVATALLDRPIPLGIIPGGSTNIVAQHLGIPSRLSDAMILIARRPEGVLMDVGLANGRAMLNMAGAGFDSRLFARTDERLKRRIGWAAYVVAGLRGTIDAPIDMDIVADGERLRLTSPLVLIANGSSVISGHFHIDSQPAIDDGWLDLFIVDAARRLATVSTAFHTVRGSLGGAPDVIYRRVRHVTIHSVQPVPYQVDGDVVGPLPLDIAICPLALRVIVPPGRSPSRFSRAGRDAASST